MFHDISHKAISEVEIQRQGHAGEGIPDSTYSREILEGWQSVLVIILYSLYSPSLSDYKC